MDTSFWITLTLSILGIGLSTTSIILHVRSRGLAERTLKHAKKAAQQTSQ